MTPSLQQSAPPDEIYDIVVFAPRDSYLAPLLWLLLGLVLLAALGFALWWWLRKRSRTQPPSPRAVAMRRLRQLERQDASMEPNELAHEISATIKNFLAETYGDPLRYETAEEFLRRSSDGRRGGVPTAARRELERYLELAEIIQFANAPDAPAHTPELGQRARSVIELCHGIGEDEASGPSPT